MNYNQTTTAIRQHLSLLNADIKNFDVLIGFYDPDGDWVDSENGPTILLDVWAHGPANAEECAQRVCESLNKILGKDYGRYTEFSQDGAWLVWTITPSEN